MASYDTGDRGRRRREDDDYAPPVPRPAPTPAQPAPTDDGGDTLYDPPPPTAGPAEDGGTGGRWNIPGGPERRPVAPTPNPWPTVAPGRTIAPAAPAAPPRQPAAVLPGWDANKWADQNHTTTKYEVGRILSNYAPTVDGLKQAWEEILKRYPGASFDGKDTIAGLPGTMGPVDVLVGASHGGDSWWWGDSGGLNAEAQARQTGRAPIYPASSPMPAAAANTATPDAMTNTATPEATTNTSYQGVYAQINNFFRQYMGRDASQQEVSQWGQNIDSNYMRAIGEAIANTQEAQAYRTRSAQPTTPVVTPTTTPATTTPTPATTTAPQQQQPYNPGQVFDDPATTEYIRMLQERVNQLMTPQQNPEMDSLLAYMQQYFQQLQNPVYTDSQRDVIATQTLDPMERQRQARKQQVIQAMASRGLGPGDGPTIQALQDVDRQFDQMRSGAQGGFALNEINLGRDNQRQAVDVGSAAAGLRNGIFQQQDARSNQALGYARQIPDMAQQRLQTAIGLLGGSQTNPAQLLSVLGGFQRNGMAQDQQDSAYWQAVIAAIMRAFGG